MKRILIIIPLSVVLFALFSCDAPRLNPLDPQSPEYNIGEISGKVYSVPHDALAGVTITWKNQKITTTTDSQGQYKLEEIKMADGIVYFEKTGFAKDSALVTWNNQRNKQLDEVILKYNTGRLKGYVRTEEIPRTGIPGAKVFWKNQNILLQTDASGYFAFENIPYVDGDLYIEKEGYTKDTVHVVFDNSKEKIIEDQFLNAIPVLDNFLLYTTVENNYPDKQKITLDVHAFITDKDGQSDIDSVFIKCADLNFSKVLIYGGQSKGYQSTSLSASDLNLISLDEAIGKNFNVVVKDKSKRVFTIGTSNIKRIIKTSNSIESPANRTTTTALPKLIWKRFLGGFSFSYTITIYTDDLAKTIMWQKSGIKSDNIDITVDSALPAGDYIWTVSCVDEFNDITISAPGSFNVQ